MMSPIENNRKHRKFCGWSGMLWGVGGSFFVALGAYNAAYAALLRVRVESPAEFRLERPNVLDEIFPGAHDGRALSLALDLVSLR